VRPRISTALIAAAVAVLSASYYSAVPSRETQSQVTKASVGVGAGFNQTVQAASSLSRCKAYIDAPSPDTPDAASYGDGLKVWNEFTHKEWTDDHSGMNYVIALAPDPIHTQLSLYFDRTMEAIQAAAQDEGYVFDSSWLPWKRDDKDYPIFSDQQKEQAAKEALETCPGVLLFRHEADSHAPPSESYTNGLAVFIVGDEPTKGVNSDQWHEAMDLVVDSVWEPPSPRLLQVLGPTFSGSLPSLARLLNEPATTAAFDRANIYSGAVWSCDSISNFQQAEDEPDTGSVHSLAVKFGVFSENSERQIYRLLMYLRSQKQGLNEVAILSEDETAYGGSDSRAQISSQARAPNPQREVSDSCHFDYGPSDTPVWLFYPRDISAVRAAYLEQSIFSKEVAAVQGRGVLTTLRPTGPGALSTEPDTIASFAGEEVSIDEEAVLYELVSFLRSHHTHYLVLRCSNPDDFLFLTRFFHRAYPEGRIITLGSDELFRREIDTSEFRGVMALTNYPLLPREQHWARLIDSPGLGRHVHRVFPADTIEGEYMAARFLFDPNVHHPLYEYGSQPYPYALHTDFKRNLPDYANPIWRFLPEPNNNDEQCFNSVPCYRPDSDEVSPPTWLVAIGRDGNWPIAVLDDDQYVTNPKTGNVDKREPPMTPPSTVTTLGTQSVATDTRNTKAVVYYWPRGGRSNPVPWRIALFGVIGFAAFGAFGLWIWLLDPHYSFRAAGLQEVFFLFHPSSNIKKEVLLGISHALPFCAALLLLMAPLLNLEAWSLNYAPSDLWVFTGSVVLLFGISCVGLAKCKRHQIGALPIFLALILASGSVSYWVLRQHKGSDHFSLLYRSAHITSGVSPILPILLLLIGLYVSTMLSLGTIDLLMSKPVRLPRSAGEDQITRPGRIARRMRRWWKRTRVRGALILSLWRASLDARIAWMKMKTRPTPKSSETAAVQPSSLPKVPPGRIETREREVVRRIYEIRRRRRTNSKLPATADRGSGPIPRKFASISLQLGCQVDATIAPLSGHALLSLPPLAIALLAVWLFWQDAGTLTLEGPRYSFTLFLSLTSVAAFAMIHALKLRQSWITMRLMLRALGRQPLRLTFAALRQCPDSSIWALGSGARGEQLRGLSNQLESLTHLRNSIKAEAGGGASDSQEVSVLPAIEMCLLWGRVYMENYGAYPSQRRSDSYYRALCRWFGRAGEDVINRILIPAWNEEKESIDGNGETSRRPGLENEAASRSEKPSAGGSSIVRAGEEFVCNVYITYIKTVLSCMRSSAKSVAILFLATGAAISSYPILSRTTVVFALLVVVIGVFILVASVYVEMARDEILSLMTGTNAGELGGEFWAKLIGFGIGPIAGLVAAQFPSIAETVFSFLGPTLGGPK
jgi:hypothetical protein